MYYAPAANGLNAQRPRNNRLSGTTVTTAKGGTLSETSVLLPPTKECVSCFLCTPWLTYARSAICADGRSWPPSCYFMSPPDERLHRSLTKQSRPPPPPMPGADPRSSAARSDRPCATKRSASGGSDEEVSAMLKGRSTPSDDKVEVTDGPPPTKKKQRIFSSIDTRVRLAAPPHSRRSEVGA